MKTLFIGTQENVIEAFYYGVPDVERTEFLLHSKKPGGVGFFKATFYQHRYIKDYREYKIYVLDFIDINHPKVERAIEEALKDHD